MHSSIWTCWAVTFFLLCSCNQSGYENNYLSFTDYNLSNYRKNQTPGGIKVYSNQDFDANKLDRLTRELQNCLGIEIRLDWFAVLIPDDWFTSPCSGQQLLPYEANPQLCLDKGLQVTKSCPCNWRVALQDNFTIVTPPGFTLYKAELARLVTGSNNPWSNESISACLTP